MTTEVLKDEFGFDSFIAAGVCLACFNTPWSAPCRAQLEILDKLDQSYGDRMIFLNVNIDYLEVLRTRFSVCSIPTLILFNRGEECLRMVGVHPETELCRAIEAELQARLEM